MTTKLYYGINLFMSKKLLITEKPSVAMEFAKVIGENGQRKNGYIESKDWIITWCVGHLVTMSYPEKYDEKLKIWRLDTLPFIPDEWKYEVIKDSERQFEIIKSQLIRDDIDTIYVATDSGREGEYIYRLVDQEINVKNKSKKRVWIDSQTEEEIKRGIEEAKDLTEYDSLSDSAYLRAKEDYLIGINFSRMLSIIYGRRLAKSIGEEKASISVGRVMTCVLGMVVEREREIRNFVKMPFYKISGKFIKEDKKSEKNKEAENEEEVEQANLLADWKVTESSKNWQSPKLYNEVGFKKENDAKEFIKSLEGKKAVVEEVKKSKQKENAPLLFNLAEIQNECTKRFKIKPDETLEIIQNLYEKKLVTYPRTDARVLSTAVAKEITKNLNGIAKGYKDEEIQGFIKQMKEEKFSTNLLKTKYVNDSKITDHYAITPTGQGYENLPKLPELQKNVYNIIVKRFLAIFYPPAEFEKLNIVLDIEGEKFNASSKVCTKKGYLEVLKKQKDDTTKKEDVSENVGEISNEKKKNETLQEFKVKKGEVLDIDNFEIKEAETTPPSRYNSGSMILAMENAGKLIEDEELREQIKGAGIGTSATRADIIKKLERIKYIEINTKTQIMTPTQKGEYIYDIVHSSMPDMLNPKLTASWEKGLDMVAKKEIKSDEFMTKLKNYINNKFDKLVIR